MKRFSAENLLDDLLEGVQIIDEEWRYVYVNAAAARHARTAVNELVNRTLHDCWPGIEQTHFFTVLSRCMNERTRETIEYQFKYPDGDLRWFRLALNPTVEGLQILSLDVTEQKVTSLENDRRVSEIEAINRISAAMRSAQRLEDMLQILLAETLLVFGCTRGAIWLWEPTTKDLRPAAMSGFGEMNIRNAPAIKPGDGIIGRAFTTNSPEIGQDSFARVSISDSGSSNAGLEPQSIAVAIRTSEAPVGVFTIGDIAKRDYDTKQISLFATISNIAGNAIQRMKLHEQTLRRLRHLSSLREIDFAIATSFDLKRNLQTVLKHVCEQLEVDAADVLLLETGTGRLEYAAGSGFSSETVETTSIRMGQSAAGQAALERKVVHIPDLKNSSIFEKLVPWQDDEFVDYHCAPLITRGAVTGVLEVFHRKSADRDREWVDFLVALAGQTAIAVDVSSLFSDLQRSREELTMAYDSTIEGWSRALDLRDKETEGHTLRVTELTVRIARAYGLRDEQLLHVRWGALLHDIGKMGVPDSILFKPGPLLEHEWAVMKQHPTLAFNMLSPILYLRNAIDIPYCHHEKWDGSGYPRGLKGEQIPLAARWFAVVDVWDALRSDRPYRLSWSEDRVLEHITALSGTQFDPEAVELFLRTADPRTRRNRLASDAKQPSGLV